MDKDLYNQFKKDKTETVGEADTAFDQSNYIDWLESKLTPKEPIIEEAGATEDQDKIRNVIAGTCLQHHDSGMSSVDKEARLIMKALNDAGYIISPVSKSTTITEEELMKESKEETAIKIAFEPIKQNIIPKATLTGERVKFVPPAKVDVTNYFKENGYSEEVGERAFKYYSEANWKDSQGRPVKNWKQKMQGVWFKPENKAKEKGMIY